MSSSEMNRADLGRALCVITGASKGFGRTVAREVSRMVKPGSALVLVARSADELRALQAELAGSMVVECVVADLCEVQAPENVVTACQQVFSDDMDHILLINNAGSLGDVSRYTRSFTSRADVDSYLSLNVSSCLCLTAGILQAFPQRPGVKRTVVNISSLCALQPFCSWVLYCTGKAARDMMFRVLAEEEPDLRVLNYAPGPLDTDMLSLAKTKTADPNVRKSFTDMFARGEVLTCEASCAKLMKLLLEDGYESGAHIDFYDI